jgi:ketosteroid isomerase-like protein
MTGEPVHEPAKRPEDLSDFFLERANAGDVDGVVALYEPDAVLAFPAGQLTVGHDQIRAVYAEFLAGRPSLRSAGQRPAIVSGDIALTSTRLPSGGATAEIARRQPDGSWRWAIDQPSILSLTTARIPRPFPQLAPLSNGTRGTAAGPAPPSGAGRARWPRSRTGSDG